MMTNRGPSRTLTKALEKGAADSAEIYRLQAEVAELRAEIDQLRKIADSKVVEVRDFEIAEMRQRLEDCGADHRLFAYHRKKQCNHDTKLIEAAEARATAAEQKLEAAERALREIADESEVHTKLNQERLCCKFQDIALRALSSKTGESDG